MRPKFAPSVLAILALIATGCEARKSAPVQRYSAYLTAAQAGSPQRFVAERDKVQITTAESGLQKSFEAAINFCGTIRCEIVSSSITARRGDSLPSGDISLRVAPEDLKKLLDYV